MKMGPSAKPKTHHRSPVVPVARRDQRPPERCNTVGPEPSPTSPPTDHTSSSLVPQTESNAAGSSSCTSCHSGACAPGASEPQPAASDDRKSEEPRKKQRERIIEPCSLAHRGARLAG